eukprot:3663489-Prymnesium_polylepis.1
MLAVSADAPASSMAMDCVGALHLCTRGSRHGTTQRRVRETHMQLAAEQRGKDDSVTTENVSALTVGSVLSDFSGSLHRHGEPWAFARRRRVRAHLLH